MRNLGYKKAKLWQKYQRKQLQMLEAGAFEQNHVSILTITFILQSKLFLLHM